MQHLLLSVALIASVSSITFAETAFSTLSQSSYSQEYYNSYYESSDRSTTGIMTHDMKSKETLVTDYYIYSIAGKDRYGKVKTNQDAGAHFSLFKNRYTVSCVFDGHGQYGELVSKYLSENIQDSLQASLSTEKRTSVLRQIRAAIESLEKDMIMTLGSKIVKKSGSTAVISVLDKTENSLTVANIGDSRAYVLNNFGEMHLLTSDHKPGMARERDRIEKEFTTDGDTVAGLATSRSLGDTFAHNEGVISTPEFSFMALEEGMEYYLICGTDGVWDELKAFEVKEVVRSTGKSVKNMVKEIAFKALQAWVVSNIEIYKKPYIDDITLSITKIEMSSNKR